MLVKDPNNIRLAMIGMVEANGHPYSWTAILNGKYDAAIMAECGYPVIPQYLGAQPKEALGIPGASVTHIWCDDPADADKVSRATFIPNIVKQATDVIGKVDAVIIPTDKPEEHQERARPFIEAGIPVFIDKPLTNQEAHLQQFVKWQREGKAILSTSGLRYAVEFQNLRNNIASLGELRLLTHTMCKSWERYGIHALEAVYPFLTPGEWLSASHAGTETANIVNVRHASGVEVVLPVISDLYGGFGVLSAYGTKSHAVVQFKDTFTSFKNQLVAVIDWLRTGKMPVPFEQTVELMKIVIAAQKSRSENGRVVKLSEIKS